MSQISPARAAAFRILMEVERGKAHSDELLRAKNVSALSDADRHLTTALVLGVLRWQINLDAVVSVLLAKPNARLDIEVRIALRVGALQLLHMDRIPARAAIDESVELAKRAGHQFASRMVNAVLRKLAAAVAAGSVERIEDARTAYPAWITERWEIFWGAEAAQAVCDAGQSQPQQTIFLVDPKAETELEALGIQLSAGELLTSARHVGAGDVTATDAFKTGRVRLQDEGSQLVAEIAGKGQMILDCCAAPGGKTLILAERNPGAKIVACEVNEHRIARLRERLAPSGKRIECHLVDATALTEEGVYDLVLADVPCSGTGTLGRNPEIRHRLELDDLPRQAERQKAILRAAIRATRPGGRVVYSTCSLEPEENEQVIGAVLRDQSTTKVVSAARRVEELKTEGLLASKGAEKLMRSVTEEGYLRLLPGEFHTDGFFVAIFAKAAG